MSSQQITSCFWYPRGSNTCCGKDTIDGGIYCQKHTRNNNYIDSCTWVLTRGKNKGHECRKKATKGSSYCSIHQKRSEGPAPKTCPWVIGRGKNKGRECGKKITKHSPSEVYCKAHAAIPIRKNCNWVLTRGPRKGAKCGKSSRDTDYCKFHTKPVDTRGRKDTCAWTLTKGPLQGQRCPRSSTIPFPFCSYHMRIKAARYNLETTSETPCKWLIVSTPEQLSYDEPAQACGENSIVGTTYCIHHLFLKQAWKQTIKGITPRCKKVLDRRHSHTVCQNVVTPGYKKCEKHS